MHNTTWRQYRKIMPGEFILAAGDCAQGGDDKNACQFLSKTYLDVPLVYHESGVADHMTSAVLPMLEKISDTTGVKPVVAFERQNGGSSEMERLDRLNKKNKYQVFIMPFIGKTEEKSQLDTGKLGYDNNSATRPILVGDLKDAIDGKLIKIYDKPTIAELRAFIKKNGKPQAEVGAHDDLVMSLSIAWQMYQICEAPLTISDMQTIQAQFPNEDEMFKDGFY